MNRQSHFIDPLGEIEERKIQKAFLSAFVLCGNIDLVCHNVTAALVKRLAQPWVQNDQF